MKAKYRMRVGCPESKRHKYPDLPADGWFPVGYVIDHPKAWKLVELGIAEAADEECAAAIKASPEAVAKMRTWQNKMQQLKQDARAGVVTEEEEGEDDDDT